MFLNTMNPLINLYSLGFQKWQYLLLDDFEETLNEADAL